MNDNHQYENPAENESAALLYEKAIDDAVPIRERHQAVIDLSNLDDGVGNWHLARLLEIGSVPREVMKQAVGLLGEGIAERVQDPAVFEALVGVLVDERVPGDIRLAAEQSLMNALPRSDIAQRIVETDPLVLDGFVLPLLAERVLIDDLPLPLWPKMEDLHS